MNDGITGSRNETSCYQSHDSELQQTGAILQGVLYFVREFVNKCSVECEGSRKWSVFCNYY